MAIFAYRKWINNMNRFNGYQICATFSIAIFIVSFSICILSLDRHGYRISVDNYYKTLSDTDYASGELTKGQLKLCYDILADKVTGFRSQDYQIPGYEVSAVNTDRLKALNKACRAAWMIAVISFVTFVYCFILLSKRRLYMPLAYGSAFATLLTSLGALMILLSKNTLLRGIRNMILYKNYSYFVEGDIVRRIITPDFARILAIEFLVIDLVVILVFVIVNLLVKLSGKPHKF